MKILVVNGSPKNKYSITLQTTNYLSLIYPEVDVEVLHVAQKLAALKKDFSKAKLALETADLIVFSYPVYTFLAPSQLHYFVRLMKENAVNVSDKYCTQLTTSKHFYDMTAHKYIEENMSELGMRCIKGLSADMDDLLTEKGQKEARDFFDFVTYSMTNGIYEKPLQSYPSIEPTPCIPPAEAEVEKLGNVVIVTDCEEYDDSLKDMITYFQRVCPRKTRIINLHEVTIKGGCLGCMRCAVSGKCIYNDNFDTFLREEIQTADALVYAFRIKDHSMGALFKTYDDRQFCNGHRTVTKGMPVGYIVSGDYRYEKNLATVIEGRANVGGNFLAGVATDEVNPEYELNNLAKNLDYALDNGYAPPSNFYGVGGAKIFRDLIWNMRGLMKADHAFYKLHGMYDDFPQKKKGRTMLMYLVGAMFKNEKVMKMMGNRMNEGMLMPYTALFKKLNKQINKNNKVSATLAQEVVADIDENNKN